MIPIQSEAMLSALRHRLGADFDEFETGPLAKWGRDLARHALRLPVAPLFVQTESGDTVLEVVALNLEGDTVNVWYTVADQNGNRIRMPNGADFRAFAPALVSPPREVLEVLATISAHGP